MLTILTFSTRQRIFPTELAFLEAIDGKRTVVLSPTLTDQIKNNGFEINNSKTRLLSRSDRQEVTGLTVNRFVNVGGCKYVRNLRGAIHARRKFGFVKAQEKFHDRTVMVVKQIWIERYSDEFNSSGQYAVGMIQLY